MMIFSNSRRLLKLREHSFGFPLSSRGHKTTTKTPSKRDWTQQWEGKTLCWRDSESKTSQPKVRAWVQNVDVENDAIEQLLQTSTLPFIHGHIAAMPDIHVGKGCSVGAVIPTKGAIIPAAVGVDIGCGMCAVKTSMTANDLPDNLREIRLAIEKSVPHGRTQGGDSKRDEGSWRGEIPNEVIKEWKTIESGYQSIIQKHPKLKSANAVNHLGTLGTGNHFSEICLDEENNVWIMLHSGSRGIGNAIGTYFIEKAREDMRVHKKNLPDKDLAYLSQGTTMFDDYVNAISWAQNFAKTNREVMMMRTIQAIRSVIRIPFKADLIAVNCHHNYVDFSEDFGKDVMITRKGAVSARKDEFGIIPGSMGARSFIVKGKGNPLSWHSSSHGAGRRMSRTEAKKRITLDEHLEATKSVECRKDSNLIDESPGAYKNIDDVLLAQSDLVDIVHVLNQIVCVKG